MSLVRYSASLEVIQNLYMSQQKVSQAQNGHSMFPEKNSSSRNQDWFEGEYIIYNVLEQMGKLLRFKYTIA